MKVQIEYLAFSESVIDVSFVHRFGWVVCGDRGKAYLGKMSIAVTGDLGLKIGHRTYLSGDCELNGKGNIAIGSYTAIGQNLAIRMLGSHPIASASLFNFEAEVRFVEDGRRIALELDPALLELESTPNKVRPVFIGNDVWIGRNVEIHSGATIADGCVIGERSLVLNGIVTEPYNIYAGTPAKKIRPRFSDNVINELLGVKWWDWPEEKIVANKAFFEKDLTKYKLPITDLIVG